VSTTANGCLSELGYFPGMPQRLRQAEECNDKWQNENLKLYQDNRQLTKILEQQNERLKFVAAPDATKLAIIEQLQAEICVLTAERAELLRNNEALVARPPVDPGYQQLATHYQNLSEMYQLACNELRSWKKRFPSGINIVTQMPQADPSTTRHSSGDPMGMCF